MVNFVKEFETFILSENKEESLQTLVPGSEAELYLQIINKLKSVSTEFPKELEEMIEKFETKTTNRTAQNLVKLLGLLTEYDIPDMKPERKQQILQKIKDIFFPGLRFDFPKPSNVINMITENNDGVKYDNRLDQDPFDPVKQVELLVTLDSLDEVKQKIKSMFVANLLNFDLITDETFERMMENSVFIGLALYEFGQVFLDKLIAYVNRKSEENQYNCDIKSYFVALTLSQVEKLYAGITSSFVDKNMYLSEIVNKKYMNTLNTLKDLNEKREILLQIYNFLVENQSNETTLRSDILLQILENGVSVNVYDINLFKEYLKNPVYVNKTQYNLKKEQVEKINKQKRWDVLNMKLTSSGDESNIIRTYLNHFFRNEKVEIQEFFEFFQKQYLQKIYYEAQILRGDENLENEEIIKILGEDEYERIINQVYVTICPHNKPTFAIDETVAIELDIKNVQTLFVKIFEINTENYYYNKKVALNSSISLEGLIATYEEPFSYNEKPQKLFRRKFEFDKIPNRRGTFIIEFIGNGFSSRALIKKGGLSLVSRPTTFGKMLFILNENAQICKAQTTGVWVKNSFYEADKENGSIIIPYMKNASTENVIIVSENFAELAQLELTEESFSITGSFFVNHEAIIMGNTAKVLFRPYLFVNNRLTDLRLIKNPKITATIVKVENDQEIPITNVFDKLTISNNKEVEFEVQIPPKLQQMKFLFECEIHNKSKDKFDKLTLSQNYNMLTRQEDNTFIKIFLRKVENEYVLHVLGKNGEPKANLLLSVNINHRIVQYVDEVQLQTNTEGEVYLGALKDVTNLKARTEYMGNTIEQNWNLNDKPLFSYPNSIDALEGDKIVLPFNQDSFDQKNGSFVSMTENMKLIENCIDSVKVVQIGENSGRYNLEIVPPKEGKYVLVLKNYDKSISINVHKGKIWETSNYIILRNKIIENSEYRYPIHIEHISLEEEAENELFTFKVKVNKNAIFPRIHIMAYQFLSPESSNVFYQNMLNNFCQQTLHSSHSFQNWANIYLSNRQLHDEIQYVFDRKHLDRFMGNSLEKPSLLLKRQYIRDTVTETQTIKEGTEYKSVEPEMLRCEQRQPSFQLQRDIQMNYDKCCEDDFPEMHENSGDLSYRNAINTCHFSNNLSSFHNFLAHVPLIATNLRPDSEGNVTIPGLPLKKFSHLQVIAVDERSVCDEIISLKGYPVSKKNLSLSQPLDLDKYFSEIRNTELILKGNVYNIADITSTSFKLMDSLENVVNYQSMINTSLTSEWSKFNFLFKIADMSEQERIKTFSKNFCHELNLFLYFKFPNLFSALVQPVLRYKIEKTFVDFFLLNDRENLLKFCSPHKLNTLNIFEKCLLIYSIRKENPELAQSIVNNIQVYAEDKKPEPQEFKRLFNVIMNMKAEAETAALKDIRDPRSDIQSFNRRAIQTQCAPERESWAPSRMNAFNRVQRNMIQEECKMSSMPMAEQECVEGDLFGECEGQYDDECEDDYVCEKEERSYTNRDKKIQKMNIKNNLYKEAGSSKEYAESHYSKNWQSVNHSSLVKPSLFWADLARFWASNPDVNLAENFLSKNVILKANNITELILLLSVLDVPINSASHKFDRKEDRALEISSGSNIIVFTKEIKETTAELKAHLMIAQHVSQNSNRDKIVKEFLVGEIYTHETIVTNISSSLLTFELLIQIPQGSIPVQGSEYTKTISLTLDNFKTTSYNTYFYFPSQGDFRQFAPNASINGVVVSKGTPLTYKFLDLSQKKETHESLDDVLISGNKQDIMNFISGNHDFKPSEWVKIYWLLKERDFYNFIIETMRNRGLFDQNVWNFGFYHKDEQAIKEMLESSSIRDFLGPRFSSSLVSFDLTNDFNLFPHLDYHPIINARAHKLGKENSLGIMNNEFKQTYERFIIYLLRQKEITCKDYLRLCYYLVLQDRNEDAIKIFAKVNPSTFNDVFSLQVQYDYIAAYLDFTTGFPDFKVAKELCKKYKEFPLTHWRELFEEIEDQFIEYEGLEVFSDVDSLVNEEKRKKQLSKNVEKSEPTLSFKIENKQLLIKYSNLSSISVKFYLIDLEILFSRTPFIQSNSEDFSLVQPNFVNVLEVTNSTKEESIVYQIPEEYSSRNLFIEVSSLSNKCFNTYFSTSLSVTISESLGEIKITDNANKPLNKVYVKCFSRMNDGSVKFYKDGYTDLRGKFNFVSLNTDQLQQLNRFAIFVMHDEFGSMIKECNPPPNIKRDVGITSDYEAYQINRQEIKQVWRSMNKK